LQNFPPVITTGGILLCSRHFAKVDSKIIKTLKLAFHSADEFCMMNFSGSKDERLLAFYEGVRRKWNWIWGSVGVGACDGTGFRKVVLARGCVLLVDWPHVTGHNLNRAIGAVGFFPNRRLRHFIASRRNPLGPAMIDQELVLSALRQAGRIIAEHLEPGHRDAEETISKLIAVLDSQELAAAMNRLESGFGLRVVK
jgi:hypothetical protein